MDQEILLAIPGLFEAIALGAGLVSNWLGGRRQSKMHERQVASDERQQGRSLDAHERSEARRSADYRFYVQQQLALQRAERERRADALSGLSGSVHGLPSGFDLGALAGQGAPVAPPAGQVSLAPMPIQSSGMPTAEQAGASGGGLAETLSLLNALGVFKRGENGGTTGLGSQVMNTPQQRWGMQATADPFLGWAQG